jgi:hypothetical protein
VLRRLRVVVLEFAGGVQLEYVAILEEPKILFVEKSL